MIVFPFRIQFLQRCIALDVCGSHDLDQALQMLIKVIALTVQLLKQGMNCVKIGTQARIEVTQIALADLGCKLVKNFVQQCMRNLFVHSPD